MTAQTGRTIPAFTVLKLGVAGSTMIDMKINSLGDLGLTYEEVEVSAWVDAIKGVIMGKPDFSLDFGGPVDNTATTGPSTLMRTWIATPNTLLSFDVQVGVRHAWEATEQQYGLSATVATNSGVTLTKYVESGENYSATIRCTSGSATLPAWGTAVEVVPV